MPTELSTTHLALVVENGIEVHRADEVDRKDGQDWLSIVEQRPRITKKERHIGPGYNLAPDGRSVIARYWKERIPEPDPTSPAVLAAAASKATTLEELRDAIVAWAGAQPVS